MITIKSADALLLYRALNEGPGSLNAEEFGRAFDAVRQVPVVDLVALDAAAISQAASESTWMPPEYCRNEWVADVCSWLRDGPPRQKLQIEGTVDSMYTSWLTDSLGESVQVGGAYATAWEAADWCERNGFAWEVVGLADDVDPVAVLKGWRAAR